MRISMTGTTAAVAAVALALAGCGQKDTASAQPGAAETAPGAGAVTLTDRPDLSATAKALPRLVGAGPEVTRINADLDRMDAQAAEDLKACNKDAGGQGEWNRWITRPMTGPSYVTLRVHSDIYCGGAYPSTDQTAVTYDLSTGERLDWAKAIPGLSLTPDSLEDMPQGYVPNVRSTALSAFYSRKMLANTDKEWLDQCRDVFTPEAMDGQSFKIWADGEGGGVTVSPDLAHVVQACADSATLTAADLQGFNADPRLIQALTAAKAAHNWDDGEDDTTPTEAPTT